MVDELEEQSTTSFDLKHYLGIVRRRHLHFLLPLFFGWAVVWGASWVLAPRYQSSTLILVEEPTMPKNYVTPNINDDLQDRLQSITQQILSRTRLLHLIDQTNPYGKERKQRSPDEQVERMRKDINIELVRDARNEITAFNVFYSAGDPVIAQKVTSELTNLFINENLEVRQQQSEGTTKFLENQLETARKTLSDQEDKIRQFKAQHVGEMPGQLASNLQILGGLQNQLQNQEDALNTSKQQRVYLQTLADQYRSLQSSMKPGDTTPVGLPAIDQELAKLHTQLADLGAHYTDRHPDVRKVKEQIAKTEKMRDQLLAGLKSKDTDNGPQAKDDAAQTAFAAGMDPASNMPQIQSQVRANQIEIGNHERAINQLKTQIDLYQARLNQEPIREEQLAELTRGYEQSKANYDDLLKRKNESKMATSMELLQQGERFRIVDPPSFPQKPEFPNRLKFCGIGLGIGLALGTLVAGSCELLDGRLHNADEIKKLLPAEIIGEIPAIVNAADETRANRRIWLGWVTASVVFVTILAGSAFSYLGG